MDEQLRDMISRGQKLARVDDVDYLAIELVFAWPPDGSPTIYCVRADWPNTTASRLVARDQEIAELTETLERQAAESLKQFRRAESAERRVAELEQAAQIPPAVALAATGMPTDAEAVAFVAPVVDTGQLCETRGRGGWKNEKALAMHQRRAHAPPWSCADCGATSDRASADATRCKACVRNSMPVVSVPLAVALVEPPWRCVDCDSSTHTRSLSDPARCMRCAADKLTTNGHLAVA